MGTKVEKKHEEPKSGKKEVHGKECKPSGGCKSGEKKQ